MPPAGPDAPATPRGDDVDSGGVRCSKFGEDSPNVDPWIKGPTALISPVPHAGREPALGTKSAELGADTLACSVK
jgi:hypothetical protein